MWSVQNNHSPPKSRKYGTKKHETGISYGIIKEIITETLDIHCVAMKFVSRLLTVNETCKSFSDNCMRSLRDYFVGDELVDI